MRDISLIFFTSRGGSHLEDSGQINAERGRGDWYGLLRAKPAHFK
jgi:hypothetical protein